MRLVAHLSDLHSGRHEPVLVDGLLASLTEVRPRLVVISGDLTQRARRREFVAARSFLDQLATLRVPVLVVPGNHDVPPSAARSGRPRSAIPVDGPGSVAGGSSALASASRADLAARMRPRRACLSASQSGGSSPRRSASCRASSAASCCSARASASAGRTTSPCAGWRLLYACTRGIYSSRRIAGACEERLDVMEVTGLQRPDFRTGLFLQVRLLCRAAGLVRLGHIEQGSDTVEGSAGPRVAQPGGQDFFLRRSRAGTGHSRPGTGKPLHRRGANGRSWQLAPVARQWRTPEPPG